ncbi:PUTATIVE LIPOPROTEIN THIREDOXIN [hydrothermal vent metagenome]|uniref:PUTATIVE LIPOPROTEIN THIREDOXIN n=1 Tax=hydrothermal vent metagenome TaxID=652676 RepID=A0A1W1EL32_9ZZZZ
MKKIMGIVVTIILLSINAFALGAKDVQSFTLTDINGKAYNVKELPNGLDFEKIKDKIILLEFFGHRCPPCKKSIPHYISLQEKFKKDIAIVAVEVQGLDRKELASFSKKKGINYITIAQEDTGAFLDHISQRANWRGSIPFLIILNEKGAVQTMQTGMVPEDALSRVITGLIETKAKNNNSSKDLNSTK